MSTLSLGSRVGLGTASLHHLHSKKKKHRLLESAFDAGIRYFDTAPLYGHESAEQVLGAFTRGHQSRDSVVIATKIGLAPNSLVSAVPHLLLPYIALRKLTIKSRILSSSIWEPRRDHSPGHVVQRVERSLKKMGLDYLDIVYLHEPKIGDLKDTDALTEASLSLKQRGLIRSFGASVGYKTAQWLQDSAPELAEVLQVEIPRQPECSAELNNWFTNTANATFGHFRVFNEDVSAVQANERVKRVAKRAVELNRLGTVLFSTTKELHIADFVSAIRAADKLA